jgi:hypothetical protein
MKRSFLAFMFTSITSISVFAGGSAGEWLGPDKVDVNPGAYCVGPELKFVEKVSDYEWRTQLFFNGRSLVEVANVYYDGINDHIQIYSTSGVQWPYQANWGIYGNSQSRYSLHLQGDIIIDGTIDCVGLTAQAKSH